MIIGIKGKKPLIDPEAWVAPSAVVVGDVVVGAGSSIWFNAVVRSDYSWIKIGKNSSIQDNCTVHEAPEDPVNIGDYVTVGHGAILHGCDIGDGSMIGMGAIILDGARIGAGSIVAAGSLVLEKMNVPPKSLVAGMPGKVIRQVTDETVEFLKGVLATSYSGLWKDFIDMDIEE